MESCGILKVVGLLMALVAAEVQGQYTIDLSLDKSVVVAGDQVTAVCDVLNPSETVFVTYWVKRSLGADRDVEVATNKYLNDAFEDENRYRAEMEMVNGMDDISHMKYILTINTTSADNGRIFCKVDDSLSVGEDLVVRTPVKQLALRSSVVSKSKAMEFADGQEVTFDEGDVSELTCISTGAMPEPVVKMMLGDVDISSQFEATTEIISTGRKAGLQEQHYVKTLTNTHWEITYDYVNNSLRCESYLDETDRKNKSVTIDIKLDTYKPQFDCPTHIDLPLYEANVELACTVHAKPAVHNFSVMWFLRSTDIIILEGEASDGHYRSESKQDELDSNARTIVLHIEKMFPQNFRNYTLTATNAIGSNTHLINVENVGGPDKDELIKSAAVQLISVAYSAICLAVLVLLV